MSETWESMLAKARMTIKREQPYYMKSILKLIPVPVPGIRTVGVTKGWILMLDPEWLLEITLDNVVAALLHEVNHPLRKHIERMEMIPEHLLNKDIANIAMDLDINHTLREAGYVLPHGYYPEDFGLPAGLSFEEYYKALTEQAQQQQSQKPQPQKGQQGQKGQKSQSSGKGDSKEDQGQSDGDQQSQESAGSGGRSQPKDDKQGQSPSGGGGQDQNDQGQQQQAQGSSGGQDQGEEEEPGQDQGQSGMKHKHGGCGGMCGNPIDPELEKKLDAEYGRHPSETEEIVKQTLRDVKEWAAKHGRGSVPGSLLQDFKITKKKSEVPWQRKFRQILQRTTGRIQSGGMDFSLARPSKRSPAYGFPRPGIIDQEAEVAMVIDTSASMGDKQIQSSIQESISIMIALGIDTVWFTQADVGVQVPPKRTRIRDLKNLKVHGRGGTDFTDALKANAKIKPKPDLIIYHTDGDGAARYNPKIPVIWVIHPGGYNRNPDASFGHIIKIPKNAPPRGKRP